LHINHISKGWHTVASCTGQIVINFTFSCAALFVLFQQNWFRCHEFDSTLVDSYRWWLLGDNYESAVIGIVAMFQIITVAASFNLGYRFRAHWVRNRVLVLFFSFLFVCISAMCLLGPNALGCFFRINCGSPSVLRAMGYTPPFTAWSDYNNPLGHNIIPAAFRISLFSLCMLNIASVIAWELFVITGPLGRRVASNRPNTPPDQLKQKTPAS
jgi:cation-transporting ATPase 13A3/4/5